MKNQPWSALIGEMQTQENIAGQRAYSWLQLGLVYRSVILPCFQAISTFIYKRRCFSYPPAEFAFEGFGQGERYVRAVDSPASQESAQLELTRKTRCTAARRHDRPNLRVTGEAELTSLPHPVFGYSQ